jgi:L-ascorbate metabolism protein UlaG (beta-lactamase superfamily)
MRARELTRGGSRVNLRGMRSHGKIAALSCATRWSTRGAAPVAAVAALLGALGCEPPPPPPAADTSSRPTVKSGAAATSAKPAVSATASAAPAGSAAPAASATGAPVDPTITATSTALDTSAGPVVIHAVHHGTLWMELGGKVLWVDPWSEGKLDDAPKGDFVLITDIHADHLDEKALATVKKEGAVVMGPRAVAEKLPGTTVIANGETKTLGQTDEGAIEIEAVPMYNLKRGPEAGKLFHDKGRGNGYVVKFGGKKIYLSGDTECTDEMKALKDVDLAFVCMNLPYTMPPEEAAECIAAFKPRVVVPYHHRGSDLKVIDEKLQGTVEVKKLKFY